MTELQSLCLKLSISMNDFWVSFFLFVWGCLLFCFRVRVFLIQSRINSRDSKDSLWSKAWHRGIRRIGGNCGTCSFWFCQKKFQSMSPICRLKSSSLRVQRTLAVVLFYFIKYAWNLNKIAQNLC